MSVLAQVVENELDWADIFFLIAAILFGVAVFLRLSARAIDSALVALGLLFVAVGWLVL